jgi:hypothetical protein
MQASVAGMLLIPLALFMGASPIVFAQQSGSPQQQPSIPAQSSQSDSPSTAAAQSQTGSTNAAHPASQPQQNGAGPLGTAVAPKEKVTGVMGSRPAGAAIAPAKQRRVRTLLIKVGAVIGAGVAIGTVAALSKGSPSRPH